MTAAIDKSKCTGCSLCTAICPKVFRMDNGHAEAYTNPVPAKAERAAQDAANSCPAEAITLD